MNRRKAREFAFIIIFQYQFQRDLDEILKYFFELYPDCGEQAAYIKDVCEKTVEHKDEIDGMIEKYLQGWKINRVSMVSLAVMRLSVCEMLYRDDIPIPVSVNEAVTLVKKYEGPEALAFVNGILGSAQTELEAQSNK